MHAPTIRSAVQPRLSLFQPGRNCHAVAHADRLALLVDGEAYFKAFAAAAEQATRSIFVIAWDFHSNARLRLDQDHSRAAVPAEIGDFLNWLAKRRQQLQIYVLDWDYPIVFGTDRQFPLGCGLGWDPHPRVHFAYDDTHPAGACHHQKIVVIDDQLAFVGGFDLTWKRWDTPDHRAEEARRSHGDIRYPPFHDLMVAVDGAAARTLAILARQRWRTATDALLPPIGAGGDPWPRDLPVDLTDVDVAIARTWPGDGERPAIREVERLYVDMIAAAQRLIYIENQYFTSYAITEALAARLGETGGPEVVLVSRLLSHSWLEEYTMHTIRSRMINLLRSTDRENRFHLYYPHIDGLAEGTCIDVHSKLMIVDDEILRIGSANLSNRSMGTDSECDIAIEAKGSRRISSVVAGFRHRLVGEHLGLAPDQVAKEAARRGSLHGAIDALNRPGRNLVRINEMSERPEVAFELARVADPSSPVTLDELMEELKPQDRRTLDSVWAKLAAVVLVIVGLTLMWRHTPVGEWLDAEQMIAFAHEFGSRPWAPLVILAAYTPAAVVLFPRLLITLAAVVAFGPLEGFALAMTGILIAAFFSYMVGRKLPRDSVRRLAGDRVGDIAETLRRRGLMAITAVRLVPVMPFAMLGLLAGAIHIKRWHFMLGTLFGMLPGTVTTTVMGDQLETALRDPSQINYGLLAALVAVIAVLTMLVRKWIRLQEASAKWSADHPETGTGADRRQS